MSGGTRCNVTHREVTESDYCGGSRPFVARVLRAFPAEQARQWLESLGVVLKLEPTGKYFPVTDDAATVLEALLRATRQAGVAMVEGARVVRLERASPGASGGSGFKLGIQTVRDNAAFDGGTVSGYREGAWPLPSDEPDRWLEASAVVIATGGLSFPRTGSDGVGYALVTALGHTLVPPVPALTALTAADPLCRDAQGITLDAELSLWAAEKRAVSLAGSLLITHFGYSGPAALDLSRHWLRAGDRTRRRVAASFLPGETRERFTAAWLAAGRAEPKLGVRRYLGRRLPARLIELLCAEAGVTSDERVSQVDRERRAVLVKAVLSRDLSVNGTLGYEKAEVTAGGVTLAEVNPSTFESRVVPGILRGDRRRGRGVPVVVQWSRVCTRKLS